MASTTRNVKLGVCQVFFKGQDLGYTKGGVEVSVTTETHKVEIDQFGKTPVNELVMGRDLRVKVPMAETTLENMVAIMPGATLIETGGTVATGTITVTTNPTAAETIEVNGIEFTFVSTLTGAENEVLIGTDEDETAANLAEALNASNDPAVAAATYAVAAGVITVTYGNVVIYGTTGMKSTDGNAFTLVDGTATAITVSGETLAGGTNSTAKKVSVDSGIGTDLLTIAQELRLHPIAKEDDDMTEDFIVPLAGTGGALTYGYKVDEERVYNIEFTGYPDPATGRLFLVGGR